MKIGLLIIASEILEAKIIDLNTRYLAEFLKKHHLELESSLTVNDDEKTIHRGLNFLFETCDLIITSGGLGPTKDDLTKDAIATYLGRKVSFSSLAEKVARQNYERFNRPFPGAEHGYCYLPEGFMPLNNSTGFAPGLFTEHLGKYLFSGPGVPREFKSMLEDHLEVLVLKKNTDASFLDSVTVRTKKIPEEKIFSEVDKDLWDKLAFFGNVSSLPILYGVDIGVKIKASTLKELQDKKLQVLKIFDESPVKKHIWHIGSDSVEELIIKITKNKNITFGFAESCTGGLCSHRITNVSGSSQVFKGSVISYWPEIKSELLGVKPETIQEYDVVSLEVAKEMAQGLQKRLNLDIAISITGIAGPSGGTPERPIGSVCIGWATKNRVEAERFQFFGDRELLKNRFAQAALYILHEQSAIFACSSSV